MSQKLTMTNFREFFQKEIKNIVWPSFNMMTSSGRLRVHITEPGDESPTAACFTISYDTVDGLPQLVTAKTDDMDAEQSLETLEDLKKFFDEFYSSLVTRVVSVNVHLDMDTFCMHGVAKY